MICTLPETLYATYVFVRPPKTFNNTLVHLINRIVQFKLYLEENTFLTIALCLFYHEKVQY
jgi:hypothetical protein